MMPPDSFEVEAIVHALALAAKQQQAVFIIIVLCGYHCNDETRDQL